MILFNLACSKFELFHLFISFIWVVLYLIQLHDLCFSLLLVPINIESPVTSHFSLATSFQTMGCFLNKVASSSLVSAFLRIHGLGPAFSSPHSLAFHLYPRVRNFSKKCLAIPFFRLQTMSVKYCKRMVRTMKNFYKCG